MYIEIAKDVFVNRNNIVHIQFHRGPGDIQAPTHAQVTWALGVRCDTVSVYPPYLSDLLDLARPRLGLGRLMPSE